MNNENFIRKFLLFCLVVTVVPIFAFSLIPNSRKNDVRVNAGYTGCTSAAQCPGCQNCGGGYCYDDNAFCSYPQTCSGGGCSGAPSGCTSNTDCPGCQSCNISTGACYDDNYWCPTGQTCSGSTCIGGGSGCSASACPSCGDSSSCSSAGCTWGYNGSSSLNCYSASASIPTPTTAPVYTCTGRCTPSTASYLTGASGTCAPGLNCMKCAPAVTCDSSNYSATVASGGPMQPDGTGCTKVCPAEPCNASTCNLTNNYCAMGVNCTPRHVDGGSCLTGDECISTNCDTGARVCIPRVGCHDSCAGNCGAATDCTPPGECVTQNYECPAGNHIPNGACSNPSGACKAGWISGTAPPDDAVTIYDRCIPTCSCCDNKKGSCYKAVAVVHNGACGAANGSYRGSYPSGTGACTTGSITNTSVSGGVVYWTCAGTGGGTNASCSAQQSCDWWSGGADSCMSNPNGFSTCNQFNSVSGSTITTYGGNGTAWNLCPSNGMCCAQTGTSTCGCPLYYDLGTAIYGCSSTETLDLQSATPKTCADNGVVCGKCTAKPVCPCGPSCNDYESRGANCTPNPNCKKTDDRICTSCQACNGTALTAGSCVTDYNKDKNGICSGSGGTSCWAPSASCSQGTASALGGSGPWAWSCSGTCAGTTASCTVGVTPDNATWSGFGACSPVTCKQTRTCTAGACGATCVGSATQDC